MPRFVIPVVLALLTALAAPSAAVDVVTSGEAYEISGSVILDASYPSAREAAGCTGCHWRIVRACNWHAVGPDVVCESPHWPCATDTVQAEVWRADAAVRPAVDDPVWRYTGFVCLGDRPPLAADPVHAAVREMTRLGVPPLDLRMQPQPTTLTQLQTYFWTTQPVAFTPSPVSIAGVPVTLRAVPEWTWDFGDGPKSVTRQSGGPRPTGTIRHVYKRRGLYLVRVTTVWSATFDAAGITGIPVAGSPITQTQSRSLRVVEAAGFLSRQLP